MKPSGKSLWGVVVFVLCGFATWILWPRSVPNVPNDPAARNLPIAPASVPRDVTASAGSANQAASPVATAGKGRRSENRRYHDPDVEASDFQPPAGRYVDVLPGLRTRAEGGDRDAAYTLARLLLDCLAVQKGESSAYGSQEPKRCEGVTVDDAREAIGWLQRAADGGLIAAQLLYPAVAAANMTPTDMIRDPAGVQDYKDRAISYLIRAAEAGSSNAMVHLGQAYKDGIIVPSNPQLAYAYAYAAHFLKPEAGGEFVLDLYSQDMSHNEIASATSMGEQILDRCCR